MSASKQAKSKKVGKVMREFKAGTLKSGGSGKKVTNPKQAIAIAMAEANAMRMGGMMDSDVMNRPMFQTPQMREGGGIMAGVAPIRGYAEGGEVNDEIVATGTEEELVDQLFGPGGLLFDTDAPIRSTLAALTIPIGGAGLLGITARGLMAARTASKAAKAAKGVQMNLPGIAGPSAASRAKSLGERAVSAAKESPKKTAAGIAALGLGAPALIGGDQQAPDAPPPEVPTPVVVTESGGGDDTETAEPQTFLDMLKGAGGQVLESLQDPATRYALAKAAQPSEGFVPRDFFSDFTLGKEEYKQLEAQRDKGTALEDNLKLLKELKPEASVDELLDLLLSKDTATEKEQRYQDAVLTLFNEGAKDPKNLDKTEEQRLLEAQQRAAFIIYGAPTSASAVGEAIDLEPTE